MRNKKVIGKNVEIIYKMEDGRISVVRGIISSKKANLFIVEIFKKVIISLDKKSYDLVDFTNKTVEIFSKTIENIFPIQKNSNPLIEGFDDGC